MKVRKADGSLQDFDKEKVIRTCLRMGASQEQAKWVADEVEKRIYENIPTKRILQLIFKYLGKLRPKLKYQRDLREAISLLKPKPDFELFIAKILEEYGYKIERNLIIPGKCVEHEVDVVAKKGKETLLIEIKHHFNHHTYTGLRVFLEAWAAYEDIKDGFKEGKHNLNFTRLLVISNTKISAHGKRFSECKGISYIGWRYPEEEGLENLIEAKKLYPISLIKGLNEKERDSLVNAGIVLIKQVASLKPEELSKKAKLSKEFCLKIIQRAKEILG